MAETTTKLPRFPRSRKPEPGKLYQLLACFDDLEPGTDQWTELQAWLLENELKASWGEPIPRFRFGRFILDIDVIDGGLVAVFVELFQPVTHAMIPYLPIE